jgi:hypothetical protein
VAHVVWKFAVEAEEELILDLPKTAKVLTVRTQYGKPHVWVMLDPEEKRIRRIFNVIPTGITFDARALSYVGTFEVNAGHSLIFHVFERL